MSLLTNNDVSLFMKGELCRSFAHCIVIIMLRIDSETWPINENELSLQRVEIRMITWTCDIVTDRFSCSESRDKLAIIDYISRESYRRREMYTGHARLSCVSVCLSVPRRIPTLLHGSGCNFGNGSGCPLVVHYWADLQSMHGPRCYDNIAQTRNVSEYTCLYSLHA